MLVASNARNSSSPLPRLGEKSRPRRHRTARPTHATDARAVVLNRAGDPSSKSRRTTSRATSDPNPLAGAGRSFAGDRPGRVRPRLSGRADTGVEDAVTQGVAENVPKLERPSPAGRLEMILLLFENRRTSVNDMLKLYQLIRTGSKRYKMRAYQ